jgi:predicted methyltransferase
MYGLKELEEEEFLVVGTEEIASVSSVLARTQERVYLTNFDERHHFLSFNGTSSLYFIFSLLNHTEVETNFAI